MLAEDHQRSPALARQDRRGAGEDGAADLAVVDALQAVAARTAVPRYRVANVREVRSGPAVASTGASLRVLAMLSLRRVDSGGGHPRALGLACGRGRAGDRCAGGAGRPG